MDLSLLLQKVSTKAGQAQLAGVMVAQEAVAASLKESLKEVDGWLCRLMDPEGRTFSEAELIRSFGWPDVDVRQQEAEEAWGE